MGLDKLLKIGFLKIGQWELVDSNLTLLTQNQLNCKNAIYAFVNNDVILYVGKTTNTLKKRFYGYQNPGSTQNTNIGVNEKLKIELTNGNLISVYIFEDKGLHKFGPFDINLAEGLEKSIIDTIIPKWNGQGKSKIENKYAETYDTNEFGEEGFLTIEEIDEIDNKLIIDEWEKVLKMRAAGLNDNDICKSLCISIQSLEQLAIDYNQYTGN